MYSRTFIGLLDDHIHMGMHSDVEFRPRLEEQPLVSLPVYRQLLSNKLLFQWQTAEQDPDARGDLIVDIHVSYQVQRATE